MIGIPVKDNGDNPVMDERFGRAQMFCIINDAGEFKIVENRAKGLASGAGGQAVKILADEDVDTVISTHIGPKATDAINLLKIKAYHVGEAKNVKEALEMLKSGALKPTDSDKPGLKRM